MHTSNKYRKNETINDVYVDMIVRKSEPITKNLHHNIESALQSSVTSQFNQQRNVVVISKSGPIETIRLIAIIHLRLGKTRYRLVTNV